MKIIIPYLIQFCTVLAIGGDRFGDFLSKVEKNAQEVHPLVNFVSQEMATKKPQFENPNCICIQDL